MLKFFFIILSVVVLASCASSNVSHDVENSVDQGVQNASNLYNASAGGDIADAYQNASQSVHGAILGGVAGTVTGALTPISALPGLLAGVVFGASYGAYLDSNMTLRDQLENRGANVMVLGDNVRIVIPSARLFNAETSTINSSAYSTVQLLAQYINHFTTMLVTISAYTDDFGTQRVSLALSNEQAKNVAKLLAANGVNTRLLYAKGYGGTHLVDSGHLTFGVSDNDRVEIMLEKLHV